MQLSRYRLLTLGVISAVSVQSFAEGSYQFGLNQPYQEFSTNGGNPVYVDVLTAGEVINIAFCGTGSSTTGNSGTGQSITVNIFAPGADPTTDTPLATQTSTGNITCDNALDSPLNPATLFQFDTSTDGTGAYVITLENNGGGGTDIDRLDISVTPDNVTAPDPTELAGRLWAYSWNFNTGGFTQTEATDADYFALIPGGRPNTNYVWKLDLNNFSGYRYWLIANDLGVDAPNSGYSVPTSGNSVTEKFPMYMGYPDIAFDRPQQPPVISDFTFIDDAGQDYAISPGTTNSVQDSGNFTFNSDVEGTYAITIDTNSDGIFGANDRLILGNMVVGSNSVTWDGTDADGTTVLAVGKYRAQLQARLGEYHFVAEDAENSGGVGIEDGLTIRLANSDGSTIDTQVYWDDETFLTGSSNLPSGASSATSAGAHTWGDFNVSGSGLGNNAFIDTYVYGASSFYAAITAISADDTLQTGVDGAITADATSAVTSGSVAISVADADNNVLSGSVETVTVSVANGTTGETELVTLTETSANSGVFAATLSTNEASGSGTDNDATMNIQVGDVLTSAYQDQLDSAGSSQTFTATTSITFNPAGDEDGDGIPNGNEETTDRDGDGIPGYLDLDSDNDGIPDEDEGNIDSDGDSIPDFLDLDSDNDGLLDLIESGHVAIASPATLDANSDGRIDSGFGSNGLADVVETSADSGTLGYTIVDTDNDGVADFRDLDSDHDGLTDVIETNGDDSDNNGMLGSGVPTVNSDGLATGAGLAPVDSDADLIFNHHDLDSDNDTLSDVLEAGGSDSDNDGILGTGVPTVNAQGLPTGAPLTEQDTDSDGSPDQIDLDSDNDTVKDIVEAGITDSNDDGQVDGFTDADGDGWDDGAASNSNPPIDTDNDGTPDYKDADDTDGDGIFDVVDLDDDNDGIPDLDEGAYLVDSDGDGVPDTRDLDSDNDGLFDLTESGIADIATLDADDNGVIDTDVGTNGLADAVETSADNAVLTYTLLDTDADNVANFRDLDSDNDGLTDVIEAFGSDPDNDGLLGTGVPAVDSQGLGSGAGLDPVDTDSDGVADHTDIDSDNDGYLDVLEAGGSDPDNDGFIGDGDEAAGVNAVGLPAAGIVTPLDTDNDGVEDQRDLDSDNDGISDVLEADGSDPDGDGLVGDGTPTVNALGQPDSGPLLPIDTDNDGTPNQLDLDSDDDTVNDILEFGYTDLDDDGLIDGFTDTDGDGRDDGVAATPLIPDDSDNDGTPDYLDADDLDNDGIYDAADLDDDNDGIPDADEGDGSVDTDGDGIADSRDLDSDNDGLFDVVEAGIGTIAEVAALDVDNDGQIDSGFGANGLADAVETAADSGLLDYTIIDTDSDLQKDFRDLDSDDDGTFDVVENGGDDPDNNGMILTGNPPTVNALGVAGGTTGVQIDTDNDGLPDYQDIDANGNGIPDPDEIPAGNEIRTGVDGVGGCSVVRNAPFDPTLPSIVLLALLISVRRKLRAIVFGGEK